MLFKHSAVQVRVMCIGLREKLRVKVRCRARIRVETQFVHMKQIPGAIP